MKKKLFWCAGSIALIVLVVCGVWCYIEVQNCQTDPNRKLVGQLHNMENALKEVDGDYECKSVSKVTPYTYEDSAGNTIVYYCCQTTYIEDEYGETTGLNTDAIGMVIDFAQIQNRQDCKVNEYDAFQCEMGERSYLCWTISPEISCVIAYSADVNDVTDIFRMAESVRSQNIPCYAVDGISYEDSTVQHTWNPVYYDGTWWNMDVTHDITGTAEGKKLYGFRKLDTVSSPEADFYIIKIY